MKSQLADYKHKEHLKLQNYRRILRDNLNFLEVDYAVSNDRYIGVVVNARPSERLIHAMCKCFIKFHDGDVWFCFDKDFLRELKLAGISNQKGNIVELEDTEYVDTIMRAACKKYKATVSEFYKCLCVHLPERTVL